MTKTSHITPVILCGGSGTRLWPLSRSAYPKQFSKLTSENSMLQETLLRFQGDAYAAPLLMSKNRFRFMVAEQAEAVDIKPQALVIEPMGRNTAPAIIAAGQIVAESDPDALIFVAPSDHVIGDGAAFHAAIEAGRAKAEAGEVVIFGIKPERPDTGFGYIEVADQPELNAPVEFTSFHEKPDLETAQNFLESGRYFWNAGMFLISVKTLASLARQHAPKVADVVEQAVAEAAKDLDFVRLSKTYGEAPDIQFDNAIMERVSGYVVPMDCGWNDLGSWKTVWEEGRDDNNLSVSGDVTSIDCENSLLRSDQAGMRVVGIGLKNIAAIAMRDAVLVADLDQTQKVKDAVQSLRAEQANQADEFPRHVRPWGWYETLAMGPMFQVKEIMVKPGAKLSLQSHVHRAEHWVVVNGTARVTNGDDVSLLTENQSTYIPLGAIHRLENPGKVDLHLIEVQSGVYLGEDDIIRYEDDYARAADEHH